MRRASVVLAVVITSMLLNITGEDRVQAHSGTCNLPWDRPDGLIIKPENSNAQYLIQDCRKRHIANPYDLGSHRFDSTYVTVSAQEASAPGDGAVIRGREGTLYRENGSTAVYVIDETGPGVYRKRWISGAGWSTFFSSCGYTDTHITQVPSGWMNTNYPSNGPNVTNESWRPDGQAILDPDGGPYLLEAGEVTGKPNKRKFSSYDALYTYNFPYPTCYVSSTTYPRVTPDLRAREGTRFKSSASTAQYLIERSGGSYCKRFLFYNSLIFYQMNGTLRTWSSGEVNSYCDLSHIHPVKTIWRARWGRTPSASAPLTFDRSYQCSGCQTAWATGITSAFNQWNGSRLANAVKVGG